MIDCTYAERLSDDLRIPYPAAIFGIHFPLRIEPTIFTFAEKLSPDYRGGNWHFYALPNEGFYMAPDHEAPFRVVSENGYEGSITADALGITACLYAFSNLSFAGDAVAETCARQFHLLREYMHEHAEALAIIEATD